MRKVIFIVLSVVFVASCTDATQIEKLQKEIDNLKIERDFLTQFLNEEKPVSNP